MASCITAQWSNSYTPQVRLTVTQSASTATNVTLTWKLEYVAHGKAASTGTVKKKYTAVLNGETVASGSYDINGKTGTYTIASGTKTINKTTSTQKISFSCSMGFNITWAGVYGGTKSASGSISVAAKTSYTIKYNANGGSGAPGSQTKWAGTNIKLSTTKPTRTGHTFQGWSTANDSTVEYAAGATYSANASVTLYAVWKADTHKVTYNANGGSGAPATQTKTYGTILKLSTTKPTRTNYTFKGWGTSPNATVPAYQPGDQYGADEDITLYAIWELAYTPPRITNLTVDRCTSNGTLSDEGTYAITKFSWKCDKTVSSIKIKRINNDLNTNATDTVSASGTSGTVSRITPATIIQENVYTFEITVADSVGSTTVSTRLAAMQFEIDFLKGGGGVSIGKPATKTGFEVHYITTFEEDVFFESGYQALSTENNIFTEASKDTVENWLKYNNVVAYFGNIGEVTDQPENYGIVASFSKNPEIHQIFMGQPNGRLYHRGGSTVHDGWVSSWATILDSKNYGNYAAAKTHNHEYYVSAGAFLFTTSEWLGIYDDAVSAANNDKTKRKGWIGHNGSNNLQILNEAAGDIRLINNSGSAMRLYTNLGGNQIQFYYETTNDKRTIWRPGENGGAYLGTATYRWNTGFFTNAITASDLKEKEVLNSFDMKAKEFIMGLQPIAYHRIGSGDKGERVHYGFGAQSVAKLINDLDIGDLSIVQASIVEDGEERPYHGEEIDDSKLSWGLNYNEFIAPLVKVVQSQQQEINMLKKSIKELGGTL